MYRYLWCCALALVMALGCAWGNVKLPNVFGDNMVLQRERPVRVWGTAAPGEAVTVKLLAAEAKTAADDQGAWMVELPALKEGEGLELTVTGNNTVTLKNLIVGDIWICSGQSNMEMSVGSCNSPDDVKSADFPKIRRIKVDHVSAINPEQDIPRGGWQVCSPQTVGGFTAAGYFFAREIFQQVGVPIGIVDTNWGGTRIEPWTTPAAMAAIPELAGMKKQYDEQIAKYYKQVPAQLDVIEAWVAAMRKAVAENQPLLNPPTFGGHPSAPSPGQAGVYGLYNGMINPFVRMPIKGALWYQGEANGGEDDIYYHKMRALIGGWRQVWNQGDFPFYFVQLASFTAPNDAPAGGDGWAKVRYAQTKAMSIPNTGLASAIEIGEANDIHPKNKQDVGKRLALWALNRDYGKKEIVPSGPIFKEAKVEGNKIRLAFDYVGSGLMVGKKDGRNPTVADPAGKLARFAIAGEDKVFVWADAVIDGNTVVVSSPQVAAPVAVRYAFTSNPVGVNLYNKEGLPASPFRTDTW